MEVLYSLVALCALLVLAQLSPGPDVFFVFRTALAQGFRAGAAVGCGISLGFLIQATLACTVTSVNLLLSKSHSPSHSML